MKRIAILSFIIGLLNVPIQAQAQVLTQGAADCILNVFRFKAWAVTGLDLIVTPEMLPSWRNYLAYRYPTLPLTERYTIANACLDLNNVTAKWPQMPPVEREQWQNMWATSLPQNLAFIEPVFPAGAQQLRAALQPPAAQQNAATQNRDPYEAYQSEQGVKRILDNINRQFYSGR